jgi:hypothetical protein
MTGDPSTDFAAPEGMRWVGAKDVVVAVPEEWGTNELNCEEAALGRTAPNDPHDDLAFADADAYLRAFYWPPCNDNNCDHQVWRPVYLVVTGSDFIGDRFRNELVVVDAHTGDVLTRGTFLGRP